jgi:hypothetical protein
MQCYSAVTNAPQLAPQARQTARKSTVPVAEKRRLRIAKERELTNELQNSYSLGSHRTFSITTTPSGIVVSSDEDGSPESVNEAEDTSDWDEGDEGELQFQEESEEEELHHRSENPAGHRESGTLESRSSGQYLTQLIPTKPMKVTGKPQYTRKGLKVSKQMGIGSRIKNAECNVRKYATKLRNAKNELAALKGQVLEEEAR